MAYIVHQTARPHVICVAGDGSSPTVKFRRPNRLSLSASAEKSHLDATAQGALSAIIDIVKRQKKNRDKLTSNLKENFCFFLIKMEPLND